MAMLKLNFALICWLALSFKSFTEHIHAKRLLCFPDGVSNETAVVSMVFSSSHRVDCQQCVQISIASTPDIIATNYGGQRYRWHGWKYDVPARCCHGVCRQCTCLILNGLTLLF